MLKEKEIIRISHQGISHHAICKMVKPSDQKIRQVLYSLSDLNLTYDDIKSMDDEVFLELFQKTVYYDL